MITERDAETGRGQQHSKDCEVEPINPEIPQVKRHCCQCEKEGADQERTRRPINAVRWDPERQGKKKLGRFTGSLCRPAENDILLCPGMNAAAVRTSKLLNFNFGSLPALFFYCLSRIRQL